MVEIRCPQCNAVLEFEENYSPNAKFYGGPDSVGTPFDCFSCGAFGWVSFSLNFDSIELDEEGMKERDAEEGEEECEDCDLYED